MSARAVGGFSPVLREVEAGLTLPIPERVRILRELESDLVDLTERFVGQGLAVEEARRRASEALVPDPGSLGALHRLHQPMYRRMTEHISGDRLLLAERLALALTTLTVAVGGGSALLRADLFSNPSPFLWPVLGLGGALFAVVLAKAFQLLVKRDHGDPSRGLGVILLTAGATLFTSLIGLVLDLFRLARRLEQSALQAADQVTEWLIRDTALLSVAILIALVGGLAWFALAQWVASIEEDHRDVLGLNRSHRSKGVS